VVAVTHRGAPVVAATLAVLVLAIPSGAAAAPEDGEPKPRCSTADVGGGDWPSYGHDLRQTRFQPRERVISAADAPLLTPEWSFSTTAAGGEGDITGTPVVSRGCVYAATTEGWVFALNADDGEVVWVRAVARAIPASGPTWPRSAAAAAGSSGRHAHSTSSPAPTSTAAR
jgi:glucose dehydrogenase